MPAGSERGSPSTVSETGSPAARVRSTRPPSSRMVGCGARSSAWCITPSRRRISVSAARPTSSMWAAASTARGGSRSRIRRAPPAWTTITDTEWATTSCISRAIRRRSSTAARATSSSCASFARTAASCSSSVSRVRVRRPRPAR